MEEKGNGKMIDWSNGKKREWKCVAIKGKVNIGGRKRGGKQG